MRLSSISVSPCIQFPFDGIVCGTPFTATVTVLNDNGGTSYCSDYVVSIVARDHHGGAAELAGAQQSFLGVEPVVHFRHLEASKTGTIEIIATLRNASGGVLQTISSAPVRMVPSYPTCLAWVQPPPAAVESGVQFSTSVHAVDLFGNVLQSVSHVVDRVSLAEAVATYWERCGAADCTSTAHSPVVRAQSRAMPTVIVHLSSAAVLRGVPSGGVPLSDSYSHASGAFGAIAVISAGCVTLTASACGLASVEAVVEVVPATPHAITLQVINVPGRRIAEAHADVDVVVGVGLNDMFGNGISTWAAAVRERIQSGRGAAGQLQEILTSYACRYTVSLNVRLVRLHQAADQLVGERDLKCPAVDFHTGSSGFLAQLPFVLSHSSVASMGAKGGMQVIGLLASTGVVSSPEVAHSTLRPGSSELLRVHLSEAASPRKAVAPSSRGALFGLVGFAVSDGLRLSDDCDTLRLFYGGCRVEGVAPGGPAASAGVMEGDLVCSIEGRPTPDLAALRQVLPPLVRPGATIRAEIKRWRPGCNHNGNTEILNVVICVGASSVPVARRLHRSDRLTKKEVEMLTSRKVHAGVAELADGDLHLPKSPAPVRCSISPRRSTSRSNSAPHLSHSRIVRSNSRSHSYTPSARRSSSLHHHHHHHHHRVSPEHPPIVHERIIDEPRIIRAPPIILEDDVHCLGAMPHVRAPPAPRQMQHNRTHIHHHDVPADEPSPPIRTPHIISTQPMLPVVPIPPPPRVTQAQVYRGRASQPLAPKGRTASGAIRVSEHHHRGALRLRDVPPSHRMNPPKPSARTVRSIAPPGAHRRAHSSGVRKYPEHSWR